MEALQERISLWESMSEFYLDTELQMEDYARIAQTFKISGLGIKELKDIDLYEVFPGLQLNLLVPAGAWAGFDEEWLMKKCSQNYKRRKYAFFRLSIRLYNKVFYRMRKRHWDNIEHLLLRA